MSSSFDEAVRVPQNNNSIGIGQSRASEPGKMLTWFPCYEYQLPFHLAVSVK